ncbi:MAG: pyrroline-5-carboxylate reductase [Deltaproteobacteria bacterium]|jgi:pyrroline-5-carboxylate reductase|nr:pyrroline-5-carboxylate reductase [Deltaproteobacteria bacterium]
MTIEVGFLGYGRMAQAISEGLDRSGAVPYERQAASDIASETLLDLAEKRGFSAQPDNRSLLAQSPVVIIAVKPHQVLAALNQDKQALDRQLFISIAAGVTLADLKQWLPPQAKVIRVIPNLPALVGRGVSLICAPEETAEEHLAQARSIFQSVGVTVDLDERRFDEGTAVSGSGPAYFFLIMEALIRGAVRLGLTWETARELVLRVAQGAAETALAHPELSLADLRDQVTSPGGTTAEALWVLEDGAITALLQRALLAATAKAKKLT